MCAISSFGPAVELANKYPSSSSEQTLVVVGGGAAGVYGAIWAKSCCPTLIVHVLERGQFLSKVKISGGGRCNVTTGLFTDPLMLSQQYPRGHKELRGNYFRNHGPQETVAWFEQHGVRLKTEEDGRMFPVTDDSATIVSCMLENARRLGVSLHSHASVRDITKLDNSFEISFREKNVAKQLVSSFALLATGSSSQGYEMVKRLGHTLVSPAPSLFTFKVTDSTLNQLAGATFPNVSVTLEILGSKNKISQEGSLLITHWGLSGPAILRLSAWAARELLAAGYKGTLYVDFTPDYTLDELKKLFVSQKVISPVFYQSLHASSTSFCIFQRRKLGSGPPQLLSLVKRFWQYLLLRQEVDGDCLWWDTGNKTLHGLASVLKRCSFQICGKGEYKDEFVTAGGVPLQELDLKTMESKRCSNLYIAGELLNIDGVTGGFNFQNAWTSGYLSGTAIAKQALQSSTRAS